MTGLAELGWSWRARRPHPASTLPAAHASYVGIECGGLRLEPEGPSTFLSVEFVYLPLRGVGASLLAHNVGHVLTGLGEREERVFSRVIVDWPVAFEPHVDALVSLTPAGFVLAPETFVSMGSLAGEPGVEDLSRVWLVEALNPRRLLLARLRAAAMAAGAEWGVTCTGGFDANVAALVNEELDLADGPFPTEHLLPYGLLPFMEGRAATFRKSIPFSPSLAEKARAHADALALACLEAESAGVRTVALVDEWGLLNLPRALAEAHHLGHAQEARVTSLAARREAHRERGETASDRGRTRVGGQSSRLVPARPTPEHHAQYAGCNGFQSRALQQAFDAASAAGAPVTKTPLACFAESLVSSFDAASARFEEWTRTSVSRHERASVFRFLRRLAKEQGRAFPTQFDMLVAAQSVVNSNLSYEWLKECRTFPGDGAGAAQALPEIQMPLAAFTPRVSTLSVERFDTLQRHRPRAKPRAMGKGHRIDLGPETAVDEAKHADNAWVHGNHPYSCSFPDEDVFMEEFSFALRKQASEKVRGLETRTHELTTSLEDGLDLRQSIRQWHAGKLFVREEVNLAKADIGAIVFRFESGLPPEEVEDRYAWRAFWQAEAHDNSHLLFYATPFQDALIGPGVAKSEFGGFAVLPLTSIAFDPWHDPYIRSLCRTPAEALLLASALATRERSLLYVSPEPPPKETAALVKRSGKSIIYQRLDDCPPDKIRRLRTFHILAEAGVRAYAHKYIRKDS